MAYFKFHKKNYWEISKLTDSKINPSRENHAHFISCKPPHKNHPREYFGPTLWFIQIATSVVEKSQILSVAFHLSATVEQLFLLGFLTVLGVPGHRFVGLMFLIMVALSNDVFMGLGGSFPSVHRSSCSDQKTDWKWTECNQRQPVHWLRLCHLGAHPVARGVHCTITVYGHKHSVP